MNLAAPLGFLGLLGLAILILIYLLKPNYQQKLVSSTFVWKLSLKYKRKKVPINKIRNIIILICQILIILLCAFIMAKPVVAVEVDESTEKVVIIDASASMLTKYDGTTRYERAVSQVKELTSELLSDPQGILTVIIAGEENEVLVYRADSSMLDEVNDNLDALLTVDIDGVFDHCTFGSVDIDGAIKMAEDLVFDNDKAEILLFTGTSYVEKSGVTVVNVSSAGEWNAAILDCTATLEDGFYVFEVQVACYGADKELIVSGMVHGANREKIGDNWITTDIFLTSQKDRFTDDKIKTLTFMTVDEIDGVYTFEDVYFSLEAVDDSFPYDNYFYLFNGNAASRTINVQYCSSSPNSFVPDAISSVRNVYRDQRDISFTEIRTGVPITEGFDLYIFEHTMPKEMPTDGVVFLINPDATPRGLDISLDYSHPISGEFFVAPGNSHFLTRYVDLTTIYVSLFTPIRNYAPGFEPLLYCAGDPIMLAKNEVDSKVIVLSCSLNNSSFPGIMHLSAIFYNLFHYYFPFTVSGSNNNVFEVNEEIQLRTRGDKLVLSGGGLDEDHFVGVGEYETLKISRNGSYTISQQVINGEIISDHFFVQIPQKESYITREDGIFVTRIVNDTKAVSNQDLIVYFAAAMVLLLVAEWWLHSRESKV